MKCQSVDWYFDIKAWVTPSETLQFCEMSIVNNRNHYCLTHTEKLSFYCDIIWGYFKINDDIHIVLIRINSFAEQNNFINTPKSSIWLIESSWLADHVSKLLYGCSRLICAIIFCFSCFTLAVKLRKRKRSAFDPLLNLTLGLQPYVVLQEISISYNVYVQIHIKNMQLIYIHCRLKYDPEAM